LTSPYRRDGTRIDVKTIRARTRLSQAKFAAKLRPRCVTGNSIGGRRMPRPGHCRGWWMRTRRRHWLWSSGWP